MLSKINDWFVGNMGVGGEYQYKAIHLYTVLVILIVSIVFGIIAASKKISENKKHILIVSIATFQLVFEVVWRILYFTLRDQTLLSLYPMYPCNLSGIIIPILALTNCKVGKHMFYLFGFVTGIITFLMPEGIFCSNVLTFPILKSILQHTGIIIIPLLENLSGRCKTSLKSFGWAVLGIFIHIINAEVIDPYLGFEGDFMFFRSGLPFIIPGVPTWFTISFFALIVLVTLAFFADMKTSVEWIKEIKFNVKERYQRKHS